jgi:hypothetical protein
MGGMTAATRGSGVASAFGVKQAQHWWLAGLALVVMAAALIALLFAVQSGPSVRSAVVAPQPVLQVDHVIDHEAQPIFFPGRPY